MWGFRIITQFGPPQVYDAERDRTFTNWVDPTLDLVLAPRVPLQRYVKTFYQKQKAIAKFFGHAANVNDETRPQYGGIRAVVVGFRKTSELRACWKQNSFGLLLSLLLVLGLSHFAVVFVLSNRCVVYSFHNSCDSELSRHTMLTMRASANVWFPFDCLACL